MPGEKRSIEEEETSVKGGRGPATVTPFTATLARRPRPRPAAGGRDDRLFDEGVPGAAIGAAPEPLGLVVATLPAREDDLAFGHAVTPPARHAMASGARG